MFVSSIATDFLWPFLGWKRHGCAIFGRFPGACLLVSLLAACDAPPPATSRPGPPTFAGSQACRECHEPQFDLWQESHHALAMQEATPDTVLGDFSGVNFQYFDRVSTFVTRNGNYVVRTDNSDGDLEDFTVKFTFGVTPLQQYLVEMPDGRVQALPIAWDSRSRADGGQRWYHLYPDEFVVFFHRSRHEAAGISRK